jgi:hypothetical protein
VLREPTRTKWWGTAGAPAIPRSVDRRPPCQLLRAPWQVARRLRLRRAGGQCARDRAPARRGKTSNLHSFTTRTLHAQTQMRAGQHLAHVTVASFSCSRHATRTALTDTVQSRHTLGQPRYPRSEPVQPPRLAGVWTVADTQTHNTHDHVAWLAREEWDRLAHQVVGRQRHTWYGMVWYGMAWGAEAAPKGLGTEGARAGATRGVARGLEPPPRTRRGRRRAGGAGAAAAVAVAAAAAAEAADQKREGVATSGGQPQRAPYPRRTANPRAIRIMGARRGVAHDAW